MKIGIVWFFFSISFSLFIRAEVRYEVIDLGGFGESTYARALSINSYGQIVGDVLGNGVQSVSYSRGFNPVLLVPSAPMWMMSQALTINDQGVIGGIVDGHAAIFDPSGQGNNIRICDQDSSIVEMNDNQAAGRINNQAVAFGLSNNGSYMLLGSVNGYQYSHATTINNQGQIAGYGYKVSPIFMSDDYVPILFDTAGAGNNIMLGGLDGIHGQVIDLNDDGVIVGFSNLPDQTDYHHAVIFDNSGNGFTIDLGSNASGTEYQSSRAASINNSGQIVGHAFDMIDGKNGCAVLFDGTGRGGNVDLNTLINPELGWTLYAALDINDNGWIVGEGEINGQHHAILLKPVPEPASLAMLFVAAGFFRQFNRNQK